MRVIGLLGGMSWESTAQYYRCVNAAVRDRLGGLHSARVAMYSVDFDAVERLQQAGDWEEAARLLARAAQRVERAGADILLLCTNTMHRVAPAIEAAVSIPLLHIADAAAEAVAAAGIRTVGLLGTRFTMSEAFYRERLERTCSLRVLTPDATAQEELHRIIYDELCQGQIREASRARYLGAIDALARRGAGGVILGCTEIGLLVEPEHAPVPLFDTTRIHAQRAVEWALADGTQRD
jgi:aspartate racemase